MEKEQLLRLLAEDEIDQLLEALEKPTAARADLHKDWTAISGRHHRLSSQERRGVLQQEDIEVERNQIRDALFTLIERLYTPAAKLHQGVSHFMAQWRWPLLVLVLSSTAIGIGMLPVRQAIFQVTLKTSDLNFRLAAPWPKTFTFPANRLDLGPLQTVEGSGWQYQAEQLGQPIDLSVDTGKLEIGPLYIPAAERISLRCRANELTLAMGEKAEGEVNLFKGNLSVNPGPQTRTFGTGTQPSELIQWVAESNAQLTFRSPADVVFQLPRLSISVIEFIKKDKDEVVSALQGAKLEVVGQAPVLLEAGDYLELGALNETDFSLRQNKDTLEISIRGKSDLIKSGAQPLHLYSHKPSLLEYFYQDQKVYFFVSVLVSLVGLLWTVKGALGLGKGE